MPDTNPTSTGQNPPTGSTSSLQAGSGQVSNGQSTNPPTSSGTGPVNPLSVSAQIKTSVPPPVMPRSIPPINLPTPNMSVPTQAQPAMLRPQTIPKPAEPPLRSATPGTPSTQGISGPVPTPPLTTQLPVKPQPTQITPQNPEKAGTFKSSIRTMQDDINALKKGQKPSGIELEKEIKENIAPSTSPTGPQIIPPPKPITLESRVELGKLEKSRTLPSSSVSPMPMQIQIPQVKPSAPSPTAAIPIPGGKGGGGLFSIRNIIILVVALALIGSLLWYFLLRSGPAEVVYTPTPTPTKTATPTPTATPKPITLENYFATKSSVSFVADNTFATKFSNSLKTIPAANNIGDVGLYTLYNPANKQRYGFAEFASGVSINPPKGLASLIDDQNLYLTAVKKLNGKEGIGFIVKLNNSIGALDTLKTWESTMLQEFKKPFVFDPTKAQLKQFSDNVYRGVALRYINFPNPDTTIDYALITATNNQKYLVIVNSKEHVFTIIDKLTSMPK